MGNKPFTTLAAIVVLVVAAAHVLRIIYGWPVTIADCVIPMWVSYVAIVVLGLLGWGLFRER